MDLRGLTSKERRGDGTGDEGKGGKAMGGDWEREGDRRKGECCGV